MVIDQAIKKTIEYSEKFGMKLSEEQLWSRLMGSAIYSKQEFEEKIGRFGLIKKTPISSETKKKIQKAKKMAEKMIANNKDILMIAVTGSVAASNCQRNDDIDMLVVTKDKRLWLSRLKLLILLIKNKYSFRRYGKKEKRDAFCFNMWLEEKSLKLPKDKRSQRSAVDLVLSRVIVDRNNLYREFIKRNDWAKKWIATGYVLKTNRLKVKNRKVEKNDKGKIGDLMNLAAFAGQYVYMFPKITQETIGLKVAFFHVS